MTIITIRTKHEPPKTYRRAGFEFTRIAQEYEVDDEQLAILKTDPHLVLGKEKEPEPEPEPEDPKDQYTKLKKDKK